MKKILLGLLVIGGMSLVSCGSDSSSDEVNDSDTSKTVVVDSTVHVDSSVVKYEPSDSVK